MKEEAINFGHSFGSKKVNMGPGFMNLRFMCDCLARAIKKHIDFSKGDYWMLEDLHRDGSFSDSLEFSYKLPDNLKV